MIPRQVLYQKLSFKEWLPIVKDLDMDTEGFIDKMLSWEEVDIPVSKEGVSKYVSRCEKEIGQSFNKDTLSLSIYYVRGDLYLEGVYTHEPN
tara:strand:+ start:32 stop:307 length:276 start_codon:yes stop_codon:yes gene_type:complete